MVILIAGATHTGKTLLAQRLLEARHYPYLSIDHLKMGLIRSGNTRLTPSSPDRELEAYLWPIVREIVKTAVENRQNLIVEGCYIPYDFKKDFGEEYLPRIRALWLIFSERYLERHFDDILRCESAVEQRETDPAALKAELIMASKRDLEACVRLDLPYRLIDNSYDVDIRI